jgi:glycosyltransferase involved in cell wall biosynthesis
MALPKIHILYEYGTDFRPHASPYIRLLRPLTHPGLGNPAPFEVSLGHRYDGQPVDAVIVDRLWRPDIQPQLADELTKTVHQAGARLIYAVDDNLLDLRLERDDWPADYQVEAMLHWLREADMVWVTTQPLKKRLEEFNPHILVIPNQLDERLLVGGPRCIDNSPFERTARIKIGYMGTLTHNEDLRMVLPALQRLWQQHEDEIEFQFVGVAEKSTIREAFGEIPVRLLYPDPAEQEYPLFQLWFSSHIAWHIAISPLRDTPFTRCKSDIKFLDYCAVGAAGIYSNVTAYQSSVQHGQTGLLVENDPQAWEQALEELLADRKREQIAYNASRYLYTQRTLTQQISNWMDAVHQSL